MSRSARRRNFNLANWLVGLGVVILVVTFWTPFATSSRTARVELRADRIADLLLEHGSILQPFDLRSPQQHEILLGRLILACAMGGLPASDLAFVGLVEDGSALVFRNKHYCFSLTTTPPDPRAPPAAEGAVPALEVYAWPRDQNGPGHAAFFYSETSAPAFTRNLQSNYHGLGTGIGSGRGRRPWPGSGQRRGDTHESPFWYRGGDDERWLVRVRPD